MNEDVIIKEEHLDKYAKKEGDIYGEQNEEELERRLLLGEDINITGEVELMGAEEAELAGLEHLQNIEDETNVNMD